MKITVIQYGARHRYFLPQIFEKNDLLNYLYTDSSRFSLLGKIGSVIPQVLRPPAMKALLGRNPNLPRSKVFSLDPTNRLLTRKPDNLIDLYDFNYNSLSQSFIDIGVKDSDVFYCMDTENIEFKRYVKTMKRKLVIDVCVNPLTHRIMYKEGCKTNDGSINLQTLKTYVFLREGILKEEADLADTLVCPSEFVAKGVLELCPHVLKKIRICPYGSSICYVEKGSDPIRGRFFWAGRDWRRKGLRYLAKAADHLTEVYPQMQFRVAGVTDSAVIDNPEYKNLQFLGNLDYSQMQEEFMLADAFILPTLAEGMVGTVIEAMAAGCPVITTAGAGIDAIVHYQNGVIVPTRDVSQLQFEIEKLYNDRKFRDDLSLQARDIITEYSFDSWAERLCKIVKSV